MAPVPQYIIPVCPQPLQEGSVSIHLTDTLDPQAACVLDFSAKFFQLFILLSKMMVTYGHIKGGKYVAGPCCTSVRTKGG